jgi:bifunctional non-homologous end joining protein LigD
MLKLINPVERPDAFDHADWPYEVKFDGFRAVADTACGQLISRNGNRMQRFEGVLDLLPKGHIFNGELVVLDDFGRPQFDELLFGHGRPTYVAFDLLITDGVDLRPLPLKERKAGLSRIGEGAEGWIALTNGVVGEGRVLYRTVVEADLEGIVAKHLADAYRPKLAPWYKILNRDYSQLRGPAEWFRDRQGHRTRTALARQEALTHVLEQGGHNGGKTQRKEIRGFQLPSRS